MITTYEIARRPGSSPTARPGVDVAKLGRLQTARHEARAVIDSLNGQRHAQRDDIQRALLMFAASPAGGRMWRPGDDPAVFLELPPEQAGQFGQEVAQARDIAQKREALAALTSRIDQLAARLAHLNRLVAACEAFAHGKD